MLSSLFSAFITFIYILYGWFDNRIRGFPKHKADLLIKNGLYSFFSHICCCCGCAGGNLKYPDRTASDKDQEDFEAVILAFSDQQLVTGLALLISIYIKGDITVYTSQVATSLAWFSSTIHLATLVVLKE
jgi:hypothetical protein